MTEHNQFVTQLLDVLGREELQLKQIGAFGQAEGVRLAIVKMLKLFDEFQPQDRTIQ